MNQQHHLIRSTVPDRAAVSGVTGHAPSFSSLQSYPQHDYLPQLADRAEGPAALWGAEGPAPGQHWVLFKPSLLSWQTDMPQQARLEWNDMVNDTPPCSTFTWELWKLVRTVPEVSRLTHQQHESLGCWQHWDGHLTSSSGAGFRPGISTLHICTTFTYPIAGAAWWGVRAQLVCAVLGGRQDIGCAWPLHEAGHT